MTDPTQHFRRRHSRRPAFTLIEVMISMALVVGLIIGINAVFKMAADTVGTGQALSAKMRDARAAQSVIYGDLSHAVVSGSEFRFLVIDSRTQFAFRDVRDKENDHDYDPVNDNTFALQDKHMRTIDLDGDNTDGNQSVPGEYIPVGITNDREHRVDTLSFFAKGLYPRQTGNSSKVSSGGTGPVIVDNMTSQDAWITYGHGRVFDQSGDTNIDNDAHYPMPGAPPQNNANPRNFYATDWVLMRAAMLVVKPNADIVSGLPLDGIVDNLAVSTAKGAQRFWASEPNTLPTLAHLIPLGRQTSSRVDTQADSTQQQGNAGDLTISSARYDVIPQSIHLDAASGKDYADLRDVLEAYIEHTNYYLGAVPTTYYPDEWWDILPSSPSADPSAPKAGGGLPGRFRCNPYPSRALLANDTGTAAAESSPVLLGNCTQFIVEYAGDYLTQSTKDDGTYGDITAIGPDGVTDFFIQKVNIDQSNPPKTVPVPRIRWYGFPRDVSGPNGVPDGFVGGWSDKTPAKPPTSGPNHNLLVDVVPLRDVIQSFDNDYYMNITTTNKAHLNNVRFEREVVTTDPNFKLTTEYMPQPSKEKYIDLSDPTAGLPTFARYVCAWGPDDANKPTMLRIIFRIDDPNGRLADGQSSEFVVKLQP